MKNSIMNDLWGGLAAMLVALPSSVAFGILVYSNIGQNYSATGAMAGLLGAAALGLVIFLDHDRRSADVEAKTDSSLYVFSRSRFNEFSIKEPEIGAQVFARIALAIAQRLRAADSELRALEER